MGRRDHRTDDDEVLEDLIAGRRRPQTDDDLIAFVRSVRDAATPVEPDDELRSLFETGLEDLPETVGSTTREPVRPVRRVRIWEGVLTRLAGIGATAKIALGSAVAVAGVTGAAVVVPQVAPMPSGADVPMIDVQVDVQREAEALGERTAEADRAPATTDDAPAGADDEDVAPAEDAPEPRPPAVAKRADKGDPEPVEEETAETEVVPTPKPSPAPSPSPSPTPRTDGSTSTDGSEDDTDEGDGSDGDGTADEGEDGDEDGTGDDGTSDGDDGDGHEGDGDEGDGDDEDEDDADAGSDGDRSGTSLDRRNYRVGGGV